jgi:PTH1 family peptidyl-tRNA hydrolase
MIQQIKAIIGLGNPGSQYVYTRHNIGFRVVEALAENYNAQWVQKENMMLAEVHIDGSKILLIKPQTYMNNSGRVMNYLNKQGIKAENMLVVHDELEKPFGSLIVKQGGSHKGHNGLKSIISVAGLEFWRLRFGIGRPEHKEEVPQYVLANFKEPQLGIETLITQSVDMIVKMLSESTQ